MRQTLLISAFFACVPFLHAETWVEGTSQPQERITISSPVEEIVEAVYVNEGQVVKKGADLCKLFSTREQLEVKRLDSMIVKAQADRDTAEQLYKKKIQSRANLMEKQAELDRLKVDREIAQYEVAQRTVKSPAAGTIVYRLKDPGEAIGRVEPLFEVIDASKLKLVFFLSTKYIEKIKLGMEVEVDFPEMKAVKGGKAKLVFIDPQLDSRSGLFRARFEYENKGAKIKPGVRVRVKLPSSD